MGAQVSNVSNLRGLFGGTDSRRLDICAPNLGQ